jgi:Protein of unknown function (DUF1573)
LQKIPTCACNPSLEYPLFILILKPSIRLFMRKAFSLCVLLASFFFAAAQATTDPQEVLQLKETEHDFTKIPQGKPVYYTFQIVNTGKEALKLDDVHASCGCTTPEWSHDPIPAGATAPIRVGYNAAAEGYFEKMITITYNTNQSKQLKIKGTVWKAPEGAAPANASVQFLKKQTL